MWLEPTLAQVEGRDPEGGPREYHSQSPICSSIQLPFTTACSLPGPASGIGETENTLSLPDLTVWGKQLQNPRETAEGGRILWESVSERVSWRR